MAGTHSLTTGKSIACLAVLGMAIIAATPAPATESEIKLQPAEPEEQQRDAQPAKNETETEVCIDSEPGQSGGMNTLEDIFSLSRGDLATMLNLVAKPLTAEQPAGSEVRWTEVGTQTDPAGSAEDND